MGQRFKQIQRGFGNIYHLYWERSAFLALVGLRKLQSLSLRASSPIWASLARTRERGAEGPLAALPLARAFLARLASLAQIGELARRLTITRHAAHFYQKEMFPTGASGAFQVNFNEIHDLSARPVRRWATVFWWLNKDKRGRCLES